LDSGKEAKAAGLKSQGALLGALGEGLSG